MKVHVISAGAARGLVEALQPSWTRETGIAVAAVFGAVGAMTEKLHGGAPCDVLLLTLPMLAELAAAGHVDGATIEPLGNVRTGVAVRADDVPPPIDDRAALKLALLGAAEIYFPDPQRATAGIHFASVLRELGIADTVAARLRPYPNGATAMRAMADSGRRGVLGCTQITEILYTEGVTLVGPLPPEFELSTRYAVAVATRSQQPAAARRLIALLAGSAASALRTEAGFEAAA